MLSESQVLSSAEVRGITTRYVYISAGMRVVPVRGPHLGHLSIRSRAQGLKGLKEGGHEQVLDQGSDWRQVARLHLQHTDADESGPLDMDSCLSHGTAPKQKTLWDTCCMPA